MPLGYRWGVGLLQLRDAMRFIEVALLEPDKDVVALANAYFFPPYQQSLYTPPKGKSPATLRLPPRKAKITVYNKKSNETSIWIVELTEVHAVTRGGHHKGKVISTQVVPDVQPPMVRPPLSISFLSSPLLFASLSSLSSLVPPFSLSFSARTWGPSDSLARGVPCPAWP